LALPRLNAWQSAVLAGLHRFSERHETRLIRRSKLVSEELSTIAATVNSRGATPGQTLSRVLQELRRFGILHHVAPGVDLLLDSPISVETENYSDRALDIAIQNDALLIDDVPTSDSLVLARRRRGQSRLRLLTLANYANQRGLCDVRNRNLLIASHIVRWGEDRALRGRLANVLCLCRMHDALFEFGYISVRDDLSVLRKSGVSSAVIGYLQNTSAELRTPQRHLPAAFCLRLHRLRNGFEAER
jgi:hypothetical protein